MSADSFGARWTALLDTVPPAAARNVQRGQALARRGAVEDLSIRPGIVVGRVRDDRLSAEEVSLRWAEPSAAAWDRAIEGLAGEVRVVAALLDDTLDLDAAPPLARLGIDLVPASLRALELRCSCAATTAPCPHQAAVLVAAAVRFDRTPALLLRLRGRDRDEVLRAVRAERGAGDPPPLLELDAPDGLEAARGDLDAIEVRPQLADDPGALLDHLGEPPGVDDLTALIATVERAAATAWRLAAGDGAEAADEELLLAELRAQRVASAASLAAALGREVEDVTAHLDALFTAGDVLRTGSASS